MKPRFRLLLLVAMLATLVASAIAADIEPGSPAPALDVKKWLKGSPVKSFDKNKIYVVEFWATWCGPCLQSIPHLTEMAKANKDVTFIGVSIWEDDVNDNIANFVKNMGDKMDYNVAYSGNKDGMATTWMEPAAQNGIPAAFVIKNGAIQWIGHPMSLDKPLAEIKAGTFDLKAFKNQFAEGAKQTRKQMAGNKAYSNAMDLFKAGKREEAHKALDKAMVDFPELSRSAEFIKFAWLARENPADWEKEANKMAASKEPASIQKLCSFALNEAQSEEGHALARKAIGMVLANSDAKDFTANLYAMNVYQKTKDDKLALQCVNTLLEIFPTSPAKDSAQFKEQLEKSKKELEAKVKGAG